MLIQRLNSWFWVIAIVGLVAVPLWISNTFNDPDHMLNGFLRANNATPRQAIAYRFALHHPEVLANLPCYRGCARQGHQSNQHCFLTANKVMREKQPFDTHGLVCPMCVDIALEARTRLGHGESLKDIRRHIDDRYSHYKHLYPTPTPNP